MAARTEIFSSRFGLRAGTLARLKRRAAVKRRINEWLGAEIIEEKSYQGIRTIAKINST